MANKMSNLGPENLYMQLSASELSAISRKGSPNSNDRDAGFCSGSSEGGDDLSNDHTRLAPDSPADGSVDSLEVNVMPISFARNKRKSSEPSKVVCEHDDDAVTATTTTTATAMAAMAPLKKRIRYTSATDMAVALTPPSGSAGSVTSTEASPPPPQLWDPSQVLLPHERMPNPAQVYVRHPGVTTLHRVPAAAIDEQQEPLALVLKKPSPADEVDASSSSSSPAGSTIKAFTPKKLQRMDEDDCEEFKLTPPRPRASVSVASANDDSSASISSLNNLDVCAGGALGSRAQQRNYKNMTRERRIEANARERTRVHTISAAYETLRRSVPSYSNAQKLSKLSVLRVACSYILTLSRMAGHDYSEDQSEPSIASCFDAVTATIQTEGKVRKKKDE